MGAGTTLMRHVMQLAGDAKILICLESAQQGRFLYDRLGFEVLEVLHFDRPDGSTFSPPIMTKNLESMSDVHFHSPDIVRSHHEPTVG